MDASLSSTEEQFHITGLQQGSKDSFRVFYDRFFIPLFHFAKGYVGDSPAAEDIVTETFIKLWDKHADMDSAPRVKNFLYHVARNLAVDTLRRTERRQKRDEVFTAMTAEPNTPTLEREVLTGELFQCIYTQAEQLPEQLKQVFQLAYIKGLSNEEIARQTGLTDQTVRNYKASALKRIRTGLSGKDLFTLLLFLSFFK